MSCALGMEMDNILHYLPIAMDQSHPGWHIESNIEDKNAGILECGGRNVV